MTEGRRFVSDGLTQSAKRRSAWLVACRRTALAAAYIAWVIAVVHWAVAGARVPDADLTAKQVCTIACVATLLRFSATIALILAPAIVYTYVSRVIEPGELVCRCEPGVEPPEALRPMSAFAERAMTASCEASNWRELAETCYAEPLTASELGRRLGAGEISEERVALAAALGDDAAKSTAAAMGIAPIHKPAVDYDHWAKLPRDLQIVLRSGLPPRLCVTWGLACAERVLSRFEREFHQDTRMRQLVGAALLALRNDDAEAYEFCAKLRTWQHDSGCWVVRRSLWQRLRVWRTPGVRAGAAILELQRAIETLGSPSELWRTYPRGDISNGYMTAPTRCHWSLPSFQVEKLADEAARSGHRPDEELNWQRAALARMILRWPRWDEDREAWRRRVEEEFIPRIEKVLPGKVSFDIPKYVAQVRKTHMPWA